MALPRRAGAILLALALIAGVGPRALGDTASDLAAAREQLAETGQRIADAGRAIAQLEASLASAGRRLSSAAAVLRRTRSAVARNGLAVAAAEAEFGALRGQLDRRAAAMYMDGPNGLMSLLLGTDTYADLSDGVAFADSVARADAELAGQVELQAELLSRRRATLRAARARQAATVRLLRADQRSVAASLADQGVALAQLVAARADAEALVARLADQLAREELLAALDAVHGGTPIPFERWAGLFLARLGAPACHDNLVLVVAWQSIEFTMARFNPLSTTYAMPGATDFNWAGVKNFTSLDQGLEATVATLNLPYPGYGYGAILRDLRACAAPEVTAQAINRSRYCDCRGHYALVGLVPIVEANYDTYAKLCTGC